MKNIILDTDIGCDIDDTWALCHLLNSPELDLKLVTTVTGSAKYRAKIVAKILQLHNRTDIPIGIGLDSDLAASNERQRNWIEDVNLDDYPGIVDEDGVTRLINTLEQTENPTLICIGPLLNIEQVAIRRPDLCAKTDFIAMAGSIRKGLADKPGKIAEWNIKMQIPAAQATFAAPWKSATITPLDTCGNVTLKGERYRQIQESTFDLAQIIIQNYTVWYKTYHDTEPTQSSTLFDTVAVYLAYSQDFINMQSMFLEVDDQGFLKINEPGGKPFNVALDWTDLDAYERHLVQRVSTPLKNKM